MDNKIKKIQNLLKNKEMIIINDVFDILILLDIEESYNINEYDLTLLITREKAFLICENLFYPYTKKIKNINIISADNYQYLKNNKIFINEINQILKKEKIVKIGFTDISIAKYFKNYITFSFISPVKTLSMIKSKKEIKKIKTLSLIINNVLSKIPEFFEKGITDIEIRNKIDNLIYGQGGDRRFVPTLVGFNAKTIYPTLKNEKLKNGDMILIDFGIMKNNIGLNISKTFQFGKASKQKEKIYTITLNGLDVMESIIKEGILIKQIDKELRFYYKSHKVLRHSLEYSVKLPGTSYFEQINSINDNSKLYNNSIIKIISSLFVPGKFGVRIEKIMLINRTGGKTLV